MSDYQFRQLTSDERDLWQAFVSEHSDATPYHNWGWMNAVKQAYGFDCLAFALFEQNKVVAVLPAVKMKSVLGKVSLCALPYCDVGGLLANSSQEKKQLLTEVLRYTEQQGIEVVDLRQGSNSTVDQVDEVQKVRMLLTLPESSEQLMKNFKSKLRSQIRKSEKNGLTANLGNDEKHLVGFYQVYSRNMRDLGSPAHSFGWFKAVISAYGHNAIIANVYSDDIVIGAGLVLKSGEICSIPWASTNSDYNRLAPNMLLYWTLLAHATDAGYKTFDFGRSTLGEGTYKFKEQWGAQPALLDWQNYQHGQLVVDAPIAAKSSSLRQYVENIWRKLPVGLATTLGSNIRKYISL